jgi:hypothetical protein
LVVGIIFVFFKEINGITFSKRNMANSSR